MAEAPGSPFPAGDPRNAAFAQNIAALNHGYERENATIQEGLGKTKANALVGESELTRKEPLSFKANQHRSNAGGIASSGINAGRRENIFAEYGAKRHAIQKGVQEAEGNAQKAQRVAGERLHEGEAKDLTAASNEYYKELLAKPQAEVKALYPEQPGHPMANAYINSVFPGNQQEKEAAQRAYAKRTSRYV